MQPALKFLDIVNKLLFFHHLPLSAAQFGARHPLIAANIIRKSKGREQWVLLLVKNTQTKSPHQQQKVLKPILKQKEVVDKLGMFFRIYQSHSSSYEMDIYIIGFSPFFAYYPSCWHPNNEVCLSLTPSYEVLCRRVDSSLVCSVCSGSVQHAQHTHLCNFLLS